jgi:hypothetical protein
MHRNASQPGMECTAFPSIPKLFTQGTYHSRFHQRPSSRVPIPWMRVPTRTAAAAQKPHKSVVLQREAAETPTPYIKDRTTEAAAPRPPPHPHLFSQSHLIPHHHHHHSPLEPTRQARTGQDGTYQWREVKDALHIQIRCRSQTNESMRDLPTLPTRKKNRIR